MWDYTEELLTRFRDNIVKEHGSILCRDISRVDWNDRDQVKDFYKGDKVQECIRIVGETARLIGELLERP
jgi:hypothetical protein